MKVKDVLKKLEGLDPETEVNIHLLLDEDYDNSKKIGYAICPNCKETVILADCETDRYFTNNGDRCIYHICCECGEPIETIDLENGNKMLEE